jgi:hypothetical protein
MKLELKSIKYTEWMSEETLCFTANLWVDGKVFAEVSNQGHGGCTDVRPHSKFKLDSTEGAMPFYRRLKEVEAHCNAMPNLEPCALFAEGLPMDLELWCNMEVEAWLARRDMKRKLKSHVLFQIEGQDGIYQTKYHPRETDGSWTVFGSEKRRILNDMSEADALAIWRAN